ncbi:hypothetical protein OG21DRAFT_1491394 [Imleria badia]|nr:hypothetical protein OG21DRAFT_1491394 [Imleria badia]
MPAKISFAQKVVNDVAKTVSDIFHDRIYNETPDGKRSEIWDEGLRDLKDQLDLVHSVEREPVFIYRFLIALAIQLENLGSRQWPHWKSVMDADFKGQDHPWIHMRAATLPNDKADEVTVSPSILNPRRPLDKGKGKALPAAMEVEGPPTMVYNPARSEPGEASSSAAMAVEKQPRKKRPAPPKTHALADEEETRGRSCTRAPQKTHAQCAQSMSKPKEDAPPTQAAHAAVPLPSAIFPSATIQVRSATPGKQVFEAVIISSRRKGGLHIVPTARSQTEAPSAFTPSDSPGLAIAPAEPPKAPNISPEVTTAGPSNAPAEPFTIQREEWQQLLNIAQGLCERKNALEVDLRAMEHRAACYKRYKTLPFFPYFSLFFLSPYTQFRI